MCDSPANSEAAYRTLQALKALFEHGRRMDVGHLLAPGVELYPPTYDKVWKTPQLVNRLLGFAAEAFGGLTYTDFWSDGDRHVMRFEGAVGGERISGVDVLRLDDEGRVLVFEVFARPPRAVRALQDAMGERVHADREVLGWMGILD